MSEFFLGLVRDEGAEELEVVACIHDARCTPASARAVTGTSRRRADLAEADRVARGDLRSIANFNVKSAEARAAISNIQAHYRGYAVRGVCKPIGLHLRLDLLYLRLQLRLELQTAPRPRTLHDLHLHRSAPHALCSAAAVEIVNCIMALRRRVSSRWSPNASSARHNRDCGRCLSPEVAARASGDGACPRTTRRLKRRSGRM